MREASVVLFKRAGERAAGGALDGSFLCTDHRGGRAHKSTGNNKMIDDGHTHQQQGGREGGRVPITSFDVARSGLRCRM